MGGGSAAKDHPWEYLTASAAAAFINYPLWRASAMAQSGFAVTAATSIGGGGSGTISLIGNSLLRRVPASVTPYVYAFAPPYKGMVGVITGMTWARAAIFWGSDIGRYKMRKAGVDELWATVIPPLVVSTMVQCVNQPIVRASITLQNPESGLSNTMASIRYIYKNHGLGGLWHGTSAGILKTVPKYCTAVLVKDFMEQKLPPVEDPSSPTYDRDRLLRSAAKSATAGVAGAALTNPLDVIRNEMFKTNDSLVSTIRRLVNETGYGFATRGMSKNLVAVAIPVGCTIFFTDALIQFTTNNREKQNNTKYDGENNGFDSKNHRRRKEPQ
eukprot:CAMPEP_0201231226 /NCGR_PEP_ID=MMETSP0852-20130820/2954_1 /ASSEMBLY_ACC=CAM_ASM_000632 /TAXON_ID=183588 /ORGANISM="Pseudo-nitzschia fraudulenta, Strain WWA7" /LENGTH=327 /DNA_ID=CAMNT_0047522841 /DNA_START=165 /DNA_END=1148 /DNA_ORIENTATION=-